MLSRFENGKTERSFWRSVPFTRRLGNFRSPAFAPFALPENRELKGILERSLRRSVVRSTVRSLSPPKGAKANGERTGELKGERTARL